MSRSKSCTPISVRRSGEPVTVEEGIAQAIAMPNSVLESGVGQYAVSARGDIVIARGGLYPLRPRVVLIRAPDGRLRRLALPERQYGFVRSSPTGDRLLLQITGLAQRGGTSIALFDMARDVMTMINTSGYINDRPIWNRDGRRFVYESDAASDGRNLFVASVDAGAPPEPITTSPRIQRPAEWLPDGTIVNLQTGAGGDALWLRSPDGTMRPWLDASTPDLKFPALSPDGRRIAYVMSNQVFVRPFPGPGSAVAVSGVGASEPAWAPNGDQLYFVSQSTSARERQNVESSATALPSTSMVPNTSMPPSTSTLMAVEVSKDEPMRVGRPRPVMTAFPAFTGSTPVRGAWDVMPDGSVVMIVPADTSAQVDFNRAAIHEIHVAQRALRGLRWGAAPSTPNKR